MDDHTFPAWILRPQGQVPLPAVSVPVSACPGPRQGTVAR